jgi:amino acid adenylation domain-containing protein
MLDDASLTTVLTQEKLKGQTPVRESQALYLDSDEMLAQLQSHSTSNVAIGNLASNNLAYVIYTSGSTGNPKGVMIEHKNTNALISWATRFYGFANLKSVLASTSICFDLSVFECFAPLSIGGEVVIVKSILDLPTLAKFNDLTLINTVPSVVESLFFSSEGPLYNKVLNLAGEPLKQSLVDKLYAAGISSVYDLYGPSEDTTYSTCIERKVAGIASIGKPIANTQCYVLNDMVPVPIGVVGELHIGGVGLARGYLNQPELTREKFITNPFFDKNNPNSSERLYKTGDLVRYLADGNLEFLGRIDHQVKIRGFRIELGEIEHQLLSHDEVNDAVVVALSNEEGDQRLVAYVTHDEAAAMLDDDNDEAHILRYSFIDSVKVCLDQTLAEYMVPSTFIVLERLPLTPNGKIDRKVLPAPDMSLQQNCYVAPTNDTEKLLCGIWQAVLGVEQVGITDNFFALGGHSLLTTRLLIEINKTFDINLSMKQIFTQQTVSELYPLIDSERTLMNGINANQSNQTDEKNKDAVWEI